jgi:hypothetical protein
MLKDFNTIFKDIFSNKRFVKNKIQYVNGISGYSFTLTDNMKLIYVDGMKKYELLILKEDDNNNNNDLK